MLSGPVDEAEKRCDSTHVASLRLVKVCSRGPVTVHVVERDLLPMHVETAYHSHQWDLLKLPKHI